MKYSKKFLAIIIPLLVIIPMLVGYSLWLVGEKKEEIPIYTFKDLLENNVTLSATYKADEFDITTDNETIKNEINASFNIPWNDFKVTYYSSKVVGEKIIYDQELINSKPTNAGIYFINIKSKITSVDNDTTENDKIGGAWIQFTINQATPKLHDNVPLTITSSNNYITTSTLVKNISVTDPNTDSKYAVYHDESASKNKVEGTFTVKDITDSTTPSKAGINTYTYTFTPSDTKNFTTVEFDININVLATVKFELGSHAGGSFSYGPVYCDVTANDSKGALLVTPTNEPSPAIHYSFNCWTKVKDNAEGNNVWNFESDCVTSDITLYAYFVAVEYTITYVLDGGTNNAGNHDKYTVENPVTLLDPSKSHFSFIGWFDENGVNVSSLDISSCTIQNEHSHDVTIYARWEEIKTIKKPKLLNYKLIFNGELQTFTLSFDENDIFIINETQYKAEDLVVITGKTSGQNVGTYTLWVELNSIATEYGIKWNNNTTDKLEFKINIEAFELNSSNTSITNEDKEYSYTGNEVTPKPSKVTTKLNTTTVDLIENIDYEISYFNNINAGIGRISIKGLKNYTGSLTINFTINKAKPIINSKPVYKSIYEGELDDGSKPSISTEGSANTNGKFEFISFKNVDVIDGVNYYYSKDGYSSSDGYPAEINYRFTPNDTSNYEIINDTTSILIKPVAFSGSTYYGSIEHALSSVSSGDIFLITNSNPVQRTNAEIKSDVTLYIVYDSSIGWHEDKVNRNSPNTGFSSELLLENTLYISQNVILTNNGNIQIEGIVGNADQILAGQTSGKYTQIILEENSTINNYGNIYCLGYIKESSRNNGSKVNIIKGKISAPLVIYDYKGGSISYALHKKICPFKVYDLPNIQSNVTIKYGSIYEGLVDVYVSLDSAHFNNKINIIGTSSDENTIFKLNSDNSCVILKYNYSNTSDEILENYKNSNMDIKITGECTTGSFSLSMKYSIFSLDIDTSNYFQPIPYKFNIFLENGKLNISTKLEFMPGSVLTISNLSTLDINSKTIFYTDYTDSSKKCPYSDYVSVKNPAKLIVNGICNINSELSGIIETNENGAVLFVKNPYCSNIIDGNSDWAASTNIVGIISPDIDYAYSNGIELNGKATLEAIGKIIPNSNDNIQFNPNSTYYSYNNAWFLNSSLSISYNSNGGSSVETKSNLTITKYGYTLTENDVPDDIYREHYNFKGWYLDNNFEQRIKAGDCIYTNITLYAKWEPINYTIEYYNKYYNDSTIEKITDPNNISSFNINTTKTVLLEPINGNYVFAGWYTDYTLTNEITSLEVNTLINYLNEDNKVLLYALWYPEGTKSYTITLVNPTDAPEKSDIDKIVKIVDDSYNWNEVELPTLGGEYNNNPLENMYFAGWYKEDEIVTNINFGLFKTTDNINYTLELNATWKQKEITLTIEYGYDIEETLMYFKEGTSSIQAITPYGFKDKNTITDTTQYLDSSKYVIRSDSFKTEGINVNTQGGVDLWVFTDNKKPIVTAVWNTYCKVSITKLNYASCSIISDYAFTLNNTNIGKQTISEEGKYMFVQTGKKWNYEVHTSDSNLWKYTCEYEITYYNSSGTPSTRSDSKQHGWASGSDDFGSTTGEISIDN